MFEPAYTLFQVLGFCLAVGTAGVSLGVLLGRTVQHKRDLWLFGPRV